jgi:nitrogen fixation protein NifX
MILRAARPETAGAARPSRWNVRCRGGARMRVAFATTDGLTVDAHFGWTPALVIYEVDAGGAREVARHAFAPAGEDGDHGKLSPRLRTVEGCTLLFAAAVGAGAVSQLAALRVRTAPGRPGERIDALVERLGRLLAGTPPPWLQRALRPEPPPAAPEDPP